MCDLRVLLPQPMRASRRNKLENKGDSEKTYKKHIDRLLPFHVRPLDVSNLRDKPV